MDVQDIGSFHLSNNGKHYISYLNRKFLHCRMFVSIFYVYIYVLAVAVYHPVNCCNFAHSKVIRGQEIVEKDRACRNGETSPVPYMLTGS